LPENTSATRPFAQLLIPDGGGGRPRLETLGALLLLSLFPNATACFTGGEPLEPSDSLREGRLVSEFLMPGLALFGLAMSLVLGVLVRRQASQGTA